MPLVFKTHEESPEAVDIAGVGVLGANGKGGVPIERAAQVMSELQEQEEDGTLRTRENPDTGLDEPIPLTGPKLREAARRVAEERGWDVVNLKEDEIASLPQEMGAPEDRPPLADVAAADYARYYGGVEPVNDEPDSPEQVEGGPTEGVPDTDQDIPPNQED